MKRRVAILGPGFVPEAHPGQILRRGADSLPVAEQLAFRQVGERLDRIDTPPGQRVPQSSAGPPPDGGPGRCRGAGCRATRGIACLAEDRGRQPPMRKGVSRRKATTDVPPVSKPWTMPALLPNKPGGDSGSPVPASHRPPSARRMRRPGCSKQGCWPPGCSLPIHGPTGCPESAW